jgi:hypothetical protein
VTILERIERLLPLLAGVALARPHSAAERHPTDARMQRGPQQPPVRRLRMHARHKNAASTNDLLALIMDFSGIGQFFS